jgi:hypothetical protein
MLQTIAGGIAKTGTFKAYPALFMFGESRVLRMTRQIKCSSKQMPRLLTICIANSTRMSAPYHSPCTECRCLSTSHITDNTEVWALIR